MPYTLQAKYSKQLLKETSRAFYLSLVILPSQIGDPLGLAYLLARAADTVADSEAKAQAPRREALESLQRALKQPQTELRSYLQQFSPQHPGEGKLLNYVPQLLEELYGMEPPIRSAIVELVFTLIDGMLWDQKLFANEPRKEGLSDKELEKYTYLVAGCVGPFWSLVSARDDPRTQILLRPENLIVAEEFGKALQWVNILRDIPKDQDEHRYYLPSLQKESFSQRFLTGSRRALRAFESAKRYPTFFPSSYWRQRIAVFLPLVLGLRTLELLFRSGGPRPGVRIKVARKEVFFWLLAGGLMTLSNHLLKFALNRLLFRAEEALSRLEKRI